MRISKFKAMIIVFFFFFMFSGYPQVRHCFIEILISLRERVRRQRLDVWRNMSWMKHQGQYVIPFRFVYTKAYFAKYGIAVSKHPPYSPDIALRDFFFYFPNSIRSSRERYLKVRKRRRQKRQRFSTNPTQEDCWHCFAQWKIGIERCRDRQGDKLYRKR